MLKENGIVEINELSTNDKYLWRYIDLHKLIDFTHSSELHFTRLDKFPDPIEGVDLFSLENRAYFQGNNEEEYNADSKSVIPFKDAKKLAEYFYPINAENNQKRQFINCWFKGDRESVAMWELYSNSNSVALKVVADDFLKEMKRIAPEFIKSYGNRIDIIGDSVNYLKLNPYDSSASENSSNYSSFNKELAFQHENEYRFLISALHKWVKDEEIDFFRVKIDIKNIKAIVVCHPLMEDWKKENIKKLLSPLELNLTIEDSMIQLRREKR